MKTSYLKIGEHVIQLIDTSYFGQSLFKNDCFLVSEQRPDIVIVIQGGYGVSFVDYDVHIDKEGPSLTFRRADYLIETNAAYTQAVISVHDNFALKHALINFYSAFIVYHQWGLLIHSSCVIDKERAHIFAGPSGAGKSTAARLSSPRKLLSDEATIVKITSEQIIVFNSPFRSELEAMRSEQCHPLASIHILKQSLHNERFRCSKISGLQHLLDKIFYWKHDAVEAAHILKLLSYLVKLTPVYELSFQKNNTFWELIS
jgi:hypothetical protein